MSHKSYLFRIDDIRKEIANIENFILGYDYARFSKDQKTIHAVIRSIEIIGEAANKLPPEFTKKYNEVPWRNIVDMRNNLIHEYFGVDIAIIWQTLNEDIPNLKKFLENKTFN